MQLTNLTAYVLLTATGISLTHFQGLPIVHNRNKELPDNFGYRMLKKAVIQFNSYTLMKNKHIYIAILSLAVMSFVAFSPILTNNFVNYDDNLYISDNASIKNGINGDSILWAFTSAHAANWHPLTWVSHMLDWGLFGANPAGHHFVSLIFHICSVIFIFLFFNKATGQLWPSAFAAAFFALHPLRVESVAWVAERKDVLSMFFGAALLYVYALYVEMPSIKKYFLCLFLFVLGLMAKPMLVTLPFLLLLLDDWPFRRWQKSAEPVKAANSNPAASAKNPLKKKRPVRTAEKTKTDPQKINIHSPVYILLEKVPFIIFAIVSSILTIWAQNKGGTIISFYKLTFSERLANTLVSYVGYVGKMFWPVNLSVFYPYQSSLPPWQIALSFFILLAITVWAIYTIKTLPFIFVGWFWYLGTLIPVIGLMQVGNQAMADRYTYLPSIGLVVMIVWGGLYLLKSDKAQKMFLLPAGLVILLILSGLTWRQAGYWKSSVELFSHALKVQSDNYLAHVSLGVALAEEGRSQDSIKHYQTAIEINPQYFLAHYNMGNVYKELGDMDKAFLHFQEVIKLKPDFSDAQNNVGIILELHYKKNAEAISHYRQALAVTPDNPGYHFNLGMALMQEGKLPEATQHFQQAIELNPDYGAARRALQMAREMSPREER